MVQKRVGIRETMPVSITTNVINLLDDTIRMYVTSIMDVSKTIHVCLIDGVRVAPIHGLGVNMAFVVKT